MTLITSSIELTGMVLACLIAVFVIYKISKNDSTSGSVNMSLEDTKTLDPVSSPSTVLRHLGRTIMVSSGSMTDGSRIPWRSLCIRLGHSAIVIQNPMRVHLVRILRVTLTALLIYLRVTPTLRYVRSSSLVSTRLSEACLNLTKRFEKYSLTDLLQEFERLSLTENPKLSLLRFPHRLRIDFSLNVRSLVDSMILAELNSIDCHYKEMESPTPLSKVS